MCGAAKAAKVDHVFSDTRRQCVNLVFGHDQPRSIRALFRVINRYVGNLPPMPGVFPDYPAPAVRNAGTEYPHALRQQVLWHSARLIHHSDAAAEPT